ncbi:RsmD family RNA methyltransferase, partial [Candidatus Saccharibacteria bacterium]|nr:RsmD family RNA methyltransferase [Candidatus Saccharibacteria bacterium]
IVSGGLFENKKPHPTFNNLSDSLLNHSYSYSPNGFFQINLPVYELALKEIKKHIKTKKVLDLYSGVGTIGLSVARDKILTLVECNESAYGELLKNCQFVLSSNTSTSAQITPVLAKSEEALSYIEPDQTVILDPPRAGCDSKLITKLLEILPETIIYLSCNPSTQARDIALLTKEGNYNISQITPFNFFPKTPHIENLIILNKN